MEMMEELLASTFFLEKLVDSLARGSNKKERGVLERMVIVGEPFTSVLLVDLLKTQNLTRRLLDVHETFHKAKTCSEHFVLADDSQFVDKLLFRYDVPLVLMPQPLLYLFFF